MHRESVFRRDVREGDLRGDGLVVGLTLVDLIGEGGEVGDDESD
jgi:hypothetical protein